MKVRIQRLNENAVIPKYSKADDAGLDLVATTIRYDSDNNIVYGTGLAFEIPKGFVGMIFPRSSNCKVDLLLTNHVGVVDSGYRGEVMLKFAPYRESEYTEITISPDTAKMMPTPVLHKVGDRVGQLIILPYPNIEFEEAEELTTTERGTGSYGSTGK